MPHIKRKEDKVIQSKPNNLDFGINEKEVVHSTDHLNKLQM